MPPTTTRTGLPAGLVEQVLALTPEQRGELFELAEVADLPPDPRTEEQLTAELKRRIEDAESGRAVGVTREEAKEQVRKILREQHGFEL